MNLKNFKRFQFNGKDSYDDFGIIVTNMPPLPLPERDIESIQVTGSNKVLHIDNGAYKSFNYTIDCILKDLSKIDELKTLFKSFGTLELSIMPGRVYQCCNVNQIDFENFVNAGLEFPLKLECEPISYSKEEKIVEVESTSEIEVSGTENTYPIIQVKNAGTVTINNISFQTLEDDITLDCELQEAFNGFISKNDKVIIDDMPYLIAGTNQITIEEGNSITITYKERWL